MEQYLMEETAGMLGLQASPQNSQPTSGSRKQLIKEWLFRFGLNWGKADVAPLEALWFEAFADLDDQVLTAAFSRALRVSVFFPTVATIREAVRGAGHRAVEEEAAQKWTQVLAYAMQRSPDIPDRNPPRICEHTRHAINAAGGVDYIHDCDRESLQWARKRFIESYVRYSELQRDQFLLPDGEIKNLLAGATAQKALPGAGESYKEMRERGLRYAADCNARNSTDQSVTAKPKYTPPAAQRSLEEQKRILVERGFLPSIESLQMSEVGG